MAARAQECAGCLGCQVCQQPGALRSASLSAAERLLCASDEMPLECWELEAHGSRHCGWRRSKGVGARENSFHTVTNTLFGRSAGLLAGKPMRPSRTGFWVALLTLPLLMLAYLRYRSPVPTASQYSQHQT